MTDLYFMSGHRDGVIAGVAIHAPAKATNVQIESSRNAKIPCPLSHPDGEAHFMTLVDAGLYHRWAEETEHPNITCPVCFFTSYHPKDIEQGYCGHCSDWTSPPEEP